jgi:hypothetical protein
MLLELKKILENLGVKGLLNAYETAPWLHYDENKGITASAEVRAGPSMSDLEAEIQFLYDNPEEHKKTNPDQIMLMRCIPKGGYWSPNFLLIRGEDFVNKIGNWEEKACDLFRSCVQDIQMGKIPDIEELIKDKMTEDEDGGNGRGKIGRKSPKANPAALLGMKKGM